MIVYMARNKLNGQAYIGKTTTRLGKRMSDHKYEAFKRNRQSKFYQALREFGWEAFEWHELYKAYTKKHLKMLERNCMIAHDTIDN